MIYFVLGLFIGSIVLEPLIINFIYFSNVYLFLHIILWKKNVIKLKEALKYDK